MNKLLTKALLIPALFLLVACGSNEVKETSNKPLDPKKLMVKDRTVYNYGAQNLEASKVAKIINQSTYTTITEIDAERVPQPTFGRTLNTFVTPPGLRVLTIKYNDHSQGYMKGAPMVLAKVEAGKVYSLSSEVVISSIRYTLKDLETNKIIPAPFVSKRTN